MSSSSLVISFLRLQVLSLRIFEDCVMEMSVVGGLLAAREIDPFLL